MMNLDVLKNRILNCRECADRFINTKTQHHPRPVFSAQSNARILIAGQAPGARVYETGKPFTDASGDRLRHWMGVSKAQFYDGERIAILPMAFCFPGYNAHNADLPPPRICAQLWRDELLSYMPNITLTLVIGAYAQAYHLGTRNVTNTVGCWRNYGPDIFPLPHPSWRNTRWLRQNLWFEQELLGALRQRVNEELEK